MNAMSMTFGNDAITKWGGDYAVALGCLYNAHRRKFFDTTTLVAYRTFEFGVSFGFGRGSRS